MRFDYHRLTLTEILSNYRTGELSPVDIVRASLDRMAEVNPAINAIYHVEHDAAIVQAKQSEARWHAGTPAGPLDGIPTTVKDILPTSGMPGLYLGAAGQPGSVATTDHPSVARMREAGAVIMGRNVMCDYGIIAAGVSTRYGITRNPWDLTKTPGASSSGAAASVCAGIEPVSVGTDIVGSIRLPASYCGLVGLKPSRGRVPYYFPNSPAVVAGPLARNVTDLALFLNVLARPDSRDFTALPYDGRDYTENLDTSDINAKKILLVPDLGLGEPTSADVMTAVDSAAKVYEQLGATIDVCPTPPFCRRAYRPAENMYKVRYLSTMLQLPEIQASKSTTVWTWAQDIAAMTALDHYRLIQDVERLREKAYQLLHGYDFIIMPTTPYTAFSAEVASPDPDELFEPWANTFLFNLTEQPAASVPCGLDHQGMPIGLQIIGHRFDDFGVLKMARAFEQAAALNLEPPVRVASGCDIF